MSGDRGAGRAGRSVHQRSGETGIFAYIANGGDPEQMQSAIDIVLRRFAEYHDLEGAFGRRAITERAKGILMERHGIGEQAAFNMLRDEARRSNRKLIDIADAVVSVHSLFPAEPRPPSDAPG
jgi:AmiR/NasT family two-component response regulator